AARGIEVRNGFEFDRIVLFRICCCVATVIPSNDSHCHAVCNVDLFTAINRSASIRRNALCHGLKTGRLRADYSCAGEPGPCRRVEGMIPMAVDRKQKVDSLLSTERLQHARNGVYIRLVCHACVRESAASAVEGALRNACEVAVCQDSNVADFVI